MYNQYASEFMFPEYPTVRELSVAKTDVFIAKLNHFLDTNEDTIYELYEEMKVYTRMLEEFNHKYTETTLYAL